MDPQSHFAKKYEEDKARLQAQFLEELEEHKKKITATMELQAASLRGSGARSVAASDSLPPPAPPSRDPVDNLDLRDDLSNLPNRWTPLPRSITFRGRTVTHPERVKLLLGFARLLRKVPGSVFTDPLEDVQEMLARLRGGARSRSPPSRSRSRASESSRARRRTYSSRNHGRSSPSRSPPQPSPPRQDPLVALVDRVRRLERCVERLSAENKKILKLLQRGPSIGASPAALPVRPDRTAHDPGKLSFKLGSCSGVGFARGQDVVIKNGKTPETASSENGC
jgi:hypothetical protein